MTEQKNKKALFQLIFSIVFIFMYPAAFFALAGDLYWIEGWIYNILFFMLFSAIILYLYYKDPALLDERFRPQGSIGQKEWDKYFVTALLTLYSAWFIIIPLDARRFGWSADFPIWLEALGGIMLLICFYFYFRSFADNPFLAPTIRIQQEKNQYVVSTGVYCIVRHPMYLGSILMFIGIPLLLGSLYGIFLGTILSLLLIPRIFGEEKMLEEELQGYKEYEQKVKYRLIPFIW